MDIFFDVFHLTLPEWTDDFSKALLSIGEFVYWLTFFKSFTEHTWICLLIDLSSHLIYTWLCYFVPQCIHCIIFQIYLAWENLGCSLKGLLLKKGKFCFLICQRQGENHRKYGIHGSKIQYESGEMLVTLELRAKQCRLLDLPSADLDHVMIMWGDSAPITEWFDCREVTLPTVTLSPWTKWKS